MDNIMISRNEDHVLLKYPEMAYVLLTSKNRNCKTIFTHINEKPFCARKVVSSIHNKMTPDWPQHNLSHAIVWPVKQARHDSQSIYDKIGASFFVQSLTSIYKCFS